MGAVVDAIARHLKKGGRGITFSKEIEDQIDPAKKKKEREEMERKKKPQSAAGWIRG